MALPEPTPGLVISYSYLWNVQAIRGETGGRKDRPCAIVVAVQTKDGETLVYAVPITHSRPAVAEDVIELSARIKRRLGLDDLPSWIVVTELNCFVWPGVDLRPVSRDQPDVFTYGSLPHDIFDLVKRAIVSRSRTQRLGVVKRSD